MCLKMLVAFDIFAAWVKGSHSDARSNVGAVFDGFTRRIRIFAIDCDDAPALARLIASSN